MNKQFALNVVIFFFTLRFFITCILFVLVFSNQVTNVFVCFLELHLVHTFSFVPMEESLSSVHSTKLSGQTLEDAFQCRGVGNECRAHVARNWRRFNNGALNVVGNPLDKVVSLLVLKFVHILVDVVCGHTSTEAERGCQVLSIVWFDVGEEVSCAVSLCRQLLNRHFYLFGMVRTNKRCLRNEEEVESREGDQVDSQLSKVAVQFTREAKGRSHTATSLSNKSIQLTVSGLFVLQNVVVDVVQSLVVNDKRFVRVFQQLMRRKNSVIRFDNGIGHFGGWEHGVGGGNSVWVAVTNLQQEKSSHTRTSSSSERVENLETLRRVALLNFLADSVQHRLHKLCTFSVVSFCPVVSCSVVSKHHVVGFEHRSNRRGFNHVHGSRFQVNQNSARNPLGVFLFFRGTSEVYVNVFQLIR